MRIDRPRRTVECHCGNTFVTTLPRKQACSKRCQSFRRARKIFLCRVCDNTFTAYVYRMATVKFCSQRCHYDARRTGQEYLPAKIVGDAPPPSPNPYRLKTCRLCGTKFSGHRSSIYCSRRCLYTGRKTTDAGPANPNYRHGQCVGGQLTKKYRKQQNDHHRFRHVEVLLKRQHYRCPYCKNRITSKSADIDHINPLARGGSDNLANLQATCRRCNRRKSAKSPSLFARQMGYLL